MQFSLNVTMGEHVKLPSVSDPTPAFDDEQVSATEEKHAVCLALPPGAAMEEAVASQDNFLGASYAYDLSSSDDDFSDDSYD